MRRWLIGGILLIAAAGWLLGWSPYLRAEAISVEGATAVSSQNVITASGLSLGTPLARVNGARIERALTSIPRISSVRIIRSWPHHVILRITERTPIAMVGDQAIDRDGVRFALAPSDVAPRMRITTYTPERLAIWLDVLAKLPTPLKEEIVEVTLDGKDDIWFKTADLTVVWGSGEESDLKVSVLTELLAKPATFTRIDLSAPRAPTTVK